MAEPVVWDRECTLRRLNVISVIVVLSHQCFTFPTHGCIGYSEALTDQGPSACRHGLLKLVMTELFLHGCNKRTTIDHQSVVVQPGLPAICDDLKQVSHLDIGVHTANLYITSWVVLNRVHRGVARVFVDDEPGARW